MNPMLSQMLNNFKQGMLRRHPLAPQYYQMMQGKNQQQIWETLMNSAKARGIDINEKRFSDDFVNALGLNNPPRQSDLNNRQVIGTMNNNVPGPNNYPINNNQFNPNNQNNF